MFYFRTFGAIKLGELKALWWKILAGILAVYAVVMSFVTPLAPGVTQLSNSVLKPGLNTFKVSTYHSKGNADFDKSYQIWLTNPSHTFTIPAQYQGHDDGNTFTVNALLPQELQSDKLDLIINNKVEGAYFYHDAFVLQNFTVIPDLKNNVFQTIPIKKQGYFSFPYKTILYETLRNLNFHVTMWFALLFCMTLGLIQSVKYLSNNNLVNDRKAHESVKTGLWFAVLGLISGSIWARFTWGNWWVNDTKLNGAAIATLIYLAYLVLRSSISEEQKRARIAAVYKLFAYVMMIVFIQVLPRMTDSLHPGNGGNPAFSNYDLDNNLRLVFYPAVLAWILVAYWIYTIRCRMAEIRIKLNTDD